MDMSFQERLVTHRKIAGYKTGKEFADALGISYPSYMAFENKGREPKYETLCKIADVLHVTTDELLGHKQGNSFEYCKNLIESFEYEWMDVEEKPTGIICISDVQGELCKFQSQKEFIDYVLAWEKSFALDNNYKIYFNRHMYEAMKMKSEIQRRENDIMQYIKDLLNEITTTADADTKKQLQVILKNALATIKQDQERSADNE